MKVVVTTLADLVFTLEISDDLELENFKALCEVESGIPVANIQIAFNSQKLTDDKKSMAGYGIKDGDMVLMRQIQSASNIMTPDNITDIDFSSIQLPGTSQSAPQRQDSAPQRHDPAVLRDLFRNNPEQLSLLKHNNPRLADAITKGDLQEIGKIISEEESIRLEREREQIRLLNSDPFDLEAQKRIADQIRLKNVDANMEAAMEHNPESFATVVMLYINCKVNNHPVQAFVDSGAQATIMSQHCAERCNIMHLVDTRYRGIAKGVGTQTIIGRVHLGQIQIEKDFFANPFSILQEQPMDMLLGLDFLRRHQCIIDLRRQFLVIGTTGTETQFLSESELPECARMTGSKTSEEEVLRKTAQEADDQALAKALQASTKQAVSSSSEPDNFSEEDIEKICKLGFMREQVVEELRAQRGDVTQATAALIAKSLTFKF